MVQEPTTVEVYSFRLALEASIYQDSLHEFVKAAWHILFPATPYVDGWHIRAICKYMEAVYAGEIRRLIINLPPRHMKSLLVNVFFPAWVWTKDPYKKFVCASYAETREKENSLLCRNLITSEWYQERFTVRLSRDQAEKVNFRNDKSGYRKAYGFDGGMTGDGGDFILIDDPIKIQDAESQVVRDGANNVMDNVVPSRLNDPKTSAIVMIMQRLNEDDPTGHALEKGGWEHLVLPAKYEGERFISSIGFTDPRTEVGELLWKERFGDNEIASLEKDLSAYMWASQYQQRPAPQTGNTFLREWFNARYSNVKITAFYLSCDTASSLSQDAAKSSVMVGGLTADYRLIPVYVWADKVEFPQLTKKIEEIATLYKEKLYGVIIEAKSNGTAAAQTLRQSAPEWLAKKVSEFNPPSKLSKEERATVYSKWCENGSVILPGPSEANTDWLYGFEEDLFTFPNCAYKDKIDCLVQLIIKLEKALSQGFHYRVKR